MLGAAGVRGALEEGPIAERSTVCCRDRERRRRESKTMRSCLVQSRSGCVLHAPVVARRAVHAAEARACVSASPASFSSLCVVAPRGAGRDSTSLRSVGPQYFKSSVEGVGNLKCRSST